MNMVPFEPITMVRPAAWPCDQISALKPTGSLILLTGISSSGVAVAGCGLPFRSRLCLLLSLLVRSIGLKPGDCALAVIIPAANSADAMNATWILNDATRISLSSRTGSRNGFRQGYADLLGLRRGVRATRS